jgi:acylphosphatase
MSCPPAGRQRLDASVRGRVQGVGFRTFVVRAASRLGLSGWVANESDGSVRCVAEGPRDRLDVLLAELRQGPPGARVEEVVVTRPPATGEATGFGVRSGWHAGD